MRLTVSLEVANPPTDLAVSLLTGRAAESGGQWRAEFELTGRLGRCSFDINLPILRLRCLSATPDLLVPAQHNPIAEDSGIRFRLFEDSDPGSNWGLALGGLRLVDNPPRRPFVTVRDRLAARFPETPLFLSSEKALPLALEGSAGGFLLDLASGQLTATEDAVRVRVGVEVVNDPPQTEADPLFVWRGQSCKGVTVDLRRPVERAVLRFATSDDPTSSIVLNADTVYAEPTSATNPVIAPLEVTNGDLEVTLLHRPADNPRLDDLALTPSADGDGLILTVYAFSDARNRASRWRIRERLPLTLRARTPSRAGWLAISLAASVHAASTLPEGSALAARGLHGIIGRTRVVCTGTATLNGAEIGEEMREHPPAQEDVNPVLLSDTVLPRLDFSEPASGELGVVTVRPGETFAGQDGHSAANFKMRGGALTLPLIDRRHITEDRQSNWDREVSRIEASTLASQSRLHDKEAVHETNLLERVLEDPSTQRFDRLFTAAADEARGPAVARGSGDDERAERPFPIIGPYNTQFDYRSLGVNVQVEPKIADYMVIRKNDVAGAFKLDQIAEFVFDPSGNFMPKEGEFPQGLPKDSSSASPVVAIVKLSRKITLEQIFEDEDVERQYVIPGGGNRTVDLFDELLPADVKAPGWTGLIMFRLPILGGSNSDSREDPGLAAQLIGDTLGGELELAYLALAPVRNASGARRMSYFARVIWENGRPVIGPSDFKDPQDRNETRFRLSRIDVTWADGTLSNLYIGTRFYINSLFGIRHALTAEGTESRWIDISGRYDEDQGRVRFLADLSEPWQIFPFTDDDAGFGPLRRLALSSIEITRSGDRLAISLDGNLELQAFGVPGLGFDGFDVGNVSSIDFRGLDLFLPPLKDGLNLDGDFLEFGYPSIRINLDLKLFRIGSIELKLNRLRCPGTAQGSIGKRPLNWCVPETSTSSCRPSFSICSSISAPCPSLRSSRSISC